MEACSAFSFLRKRGPYIVPPPGCKDPSKKEFQKMVVGKFINDRDYEVEDLKEWLDSWRMRGGDGCLEGRRSLLLRLS